MSAPDPRTAQALALADEVAGQMFVRFRRRVPLDELQNLARMGALAAAQRWDGRGQFPRFAVQRIRWAILDAVRTRRRLGPRPTADSLRTAAALAAEQTADAAALEQNAAPAPVSIEETRVDPASAHESDRTAAMRAFLGRAAACFAVDMDAASTFEIADPDVDVEADVRRMRVRRAVQALPADERLVVERHGYGGETFEEIAEAEGQHRSTVFSRFTRALDRLRQTLDAGSE